ncbi:MAG: SGNH/GDSL hydrolase family protein [Bacteroidota bacterium]
MNYFVLIITIVLNFCHFSTMAQQPIRYVALGDSYTIGTGAKESEAWPVLLTKHLKENKIPIELIANPSRNGWTTEDLIESELPVLDKSKPTFVTLLIGVNDWVQGVDAAKFKKNLIFIIDHVQKQLPDKSKLVLITIPDFGVTPTGANYSGGRDISKGISEFNSIIVSEANKRKLKTVDLFGISKKMGTDVSLVAPDGLHPSAKEYAVWETLIYPVVYSLIK